jgi:hypothetical protein
MVMSDDSTTWTYMGKHAGEMTADDIRAALAYAASEIERLRAEIARMRPHVDYVAMLRAGRE